MKKIKEIRAYEKHVSTFKNDTFQLRFTYFEADPEINEPPLAAYSFIHTKPDGFTIECPAIAPLTVRDYSGSQEMFDVDFLDDETLQEWLDRDTEKFKPYLEKYYQS